MPVVEYKHDAVKPPSEGVKQSEQIEEAGSAAAPPPVAESTIVAQLPHAEQAHGSTVDQAELLVKGPPPGELLAADTTQQATAVVVEQSISLAEMLDVTLQSASAVDAGSTEQEAKVDSHLSVDHREWMTRAPARRSVVQYSL